MGFFESLENHDHWAFFDVSKSAIKVLNKSDFCLIASGVSACFFEEVIFAGLSFL